ncbi:hypothetical protein LZK73_21715 [Neorhizobium galegae]|nr:hypothetical protein LZK73_21715 [Neorhizobium galegae]
MTPDLSTNSDDDLIRELRKRNYRAIHRDELRTVGAETSIDKLYLSRMEFKQAEQYVRRDLGQQMGHFLVDHFPIQELPSDHRIHYRMTFLVLGPKVSAEDPYYMPPLRAFA